MMFGGCEIIEAYEYDLYQDELSSEMSVDSEVEFQLYNLGDVIREEEHEEKNSGNLESSSSKPNQKRLIVLSDSEVIQLSDDSIYRCKGKNVRVQAQENTHGPSASLQSNELSDIEERSGVIRELMIIEVTSSEEEESTISEGDNVEKHGINWFISDKDIEAQIANNKSPGRRTQRYYSTNKNIICRNCDKCGHLTKNCPLPGKVHHCFLCSRRGHLLYSWPAPLCEYCPVPKMLDHSCLFRHCWDKQCHYTDTCTEIWRQYHLTTKPGPSKKPKTPSRPSALAYYCHCMQKCPEREVYDPSPISPFICYYDDKYEIQKREKRLKQKIKVLKKNGDIPEPSKKGRASWKKMKNKNRNWEKHRKADRLDFPRGPKTCSSPGSFKTQKPSKPFHHSSHCFTSREDKSPKEKKKERCLEDDDNDNLFVIKQREKKCLKLSGSL
uniref:Zinc finger CCHC domain-containing protein 7 n=1 Tax=Rhinopithecus bieti TaxID=61621 RepID=A0A2K6MRT2_RHIBE